MIRARADNKTVKHYIMIANSYTTETNISDYLLMLAFSNRNKCHK